MNSTTRLNLGLVVLSTDLIENFGSAISQKGMFLRNALRKNREGTGS
jgi:hypothetical protein